MDNQKDTSQTILKSACEIFAEKGYKQASISDICEAAGTNRASINYYFRSKENLYKEVYLYAWGISREYRQNNETSEVVLCPEDKLREYITLFLRAIFSDGPEGWFHRIMHHEVVSPTISLSGVIAEVISHERAYVDDIISEITGETDKYKLHYMNMSVMSSCLFFNMTRNIRKHKLEFKEPPFDRPDFQQEEHLEAIIKHVCDFCLNGLTAGKTTGE